jgi:hypothetical protein
MGKVQLKIEKIYIKCLEGILFRYKYPSKTFCFISINIPTMSSSNDIQTNSGETSTPPITEPSVPQPTPETTTTITTDNNNTNTATITTTTTNNKNNDSNIKEVAQHNNGGNTSKPVAQHKAAESTTATNKGKNGDNKEVVPNDKNGGKRSEQVMCLSGIWASPCKDKKKHTAGKLPSLSLRGKEEVNKEMHQQRLGKFQKNLTQVQQYLTELDNFPTSELRKDLQAHLEKLKEIIESEKKNEHPKTPGRLPEINKEITKLMQQISSPDKLTKKLSLSTHLQPSNGSNGHSGVDGLVNLHKCEIFLNSAFYKEIEVIYRGDFLNEKRKKFLLSCFAVLPENAVVKRRLFTYWGVGEGFLDVSVDTTNEENTPEKIVEQILKEFQEKGLIEPAIKKREQQVKSYKMDPLVRSAVIMLSEEDGEDGFFAYDSKGNVVSNPSMSRRACLLKKEEESSSSEINSFQDSDLEKLVTLFNVNESYPDLELALLAKMKNPKAGKTNDPNSAQTNDSNTANKKDSNTAQISNDSKAAQTNGSNLVKTKDQNAAKMKDPNAVEWLSKMKNAKVVCLGSWPGSAKSHVEVEDSDFLKALENMKDLKFLSLQGIFRITKLPSSIGMLSNLLILDLKECHNLEELSEEITKLTNLRYLDLSECYLLAHMPKGLSELSHLQVLKGFVISTSTDDNKMGTLSDLKGLQKLRKLTINVSSEIFPTQDDLYALKELGEKGKLRKLTIAWSVELNIAPKTQDQKGLNRSNTKMPKDFQCFPNHLSTCLTPKNRSKTKMPKVIKPHIDELPRQLEKLDLECFPNHLSTWLTPIDLPNLEKLYIRGGDLATLDKSKWKVKSLRLKFLRELKMTWIELKDTFPDLVYLEKVNCPRISLCPCDENGVWMKPDDHHIKSSDCDFPEISTRIG